MYHWVDHTGELELAIEAASPRELFEDAVAAFSELVAEDEWGEPASHEIAIEARDRATLLAELLEQLVYLTETADFVPERVASLELAEATLHAVVEGRRGNPRHLVKAVTYHGLRFEREGEAWRASAVLDV